MSKERTLGRAWDELGRRNPLGAILTRDGRLADWDQDQFWATGVADAARFVDELSRVAPRTPRSRALDFGCGVGRLTRALSEHFTDVIGLDVAPSMIDRARAANADRARCTFVVNHSPDLSQFQSSSFDVVYSRLVLQHLQPSLVRAYLTEMLRVLSPGGVLMFQLPEPDASSRAAVLRAPVEGNLLKRLIPRPVVAVWRRLKYPFAVPRAEAWRQIIGISRPEVESIIQAAGGRLLAANLDDSHGSIGTGYEYWVSK